MRGEATGPTRPAETALQKYLPFPPSQGGKPGNFLNLMPMGRFANRPDPFAVGPDGPIRWPHWRTWAQTQRSRSSSLQTRPVAGSTARQAPPTSRVTTLPHPWLPG